MSNQDIADFYDSNPDMTLAQLARVTGKTVAQLKQILIGA
jgi:hypothetical protein